MCPGVSVARLCLHSIYIYTDTYTYIVHIQSIYILYPCFTNRLIFWQARIDALVIIISIGEQSCRPFCKQFQSWTDQSWWLIDPVFSPSPKVYSSRGQDIRGTRKGIARREALPQDDGTTITTLLKDVREALICHYTKQSKTVMNTRLIVMVNWGGLFLNPSQNRCRGVISHIYIVFMLHLTLGEMRETSVIASLGGHSCREVKVPWLIEVWWYIGIWWCGSYRQLLVVLILASFTRMKPKHQGRKFEQVCFSIWDLPGRPTCCAWMAPRSSWAGASFLHPGIERWWEWFQEVSASQLEMRTKERCGTSSVWSREWYRTEATLT